MATFLVIIIKLVRLTGSFCRESVLCTRVYAFVYKDAIGCYCVLHHHPQLKTCSPNLSQANSPSPPSCISLPLWLTDATENG